MPAVDDRRHIDIDQIPFAQLLAIVWYTMANDLVDARADRFGIAL